jgi:hypothetical protein
MGNRRNGFMVVKEKLKVTGHLEDLNTDGE